MDENLPIASLRMPSSPARARPAAVRPSLVAACWAWKRPRTGEGRRDGDGREFGAIKMPFKMGGSLAFLTKGNQWFFKGDPSEYLPKNLGGVFFYVHLYLGKWSNLTCAYFSSGLVQPPTRDAITPGHTDTSYRIHGMIVYLPSVWKTYWYTVHGSYVSDWFRRDTLPETNSSHLPKKAKTQKKNHRPSIDVQV